MQKGSVSVIKMVGYQLKCLLTVIEMSAITCYFIFGS